MQDLRLQMEYLRRWTGNQLQPGFRFGRENGWHCGHWHWSLDEASECVRGVNKPEPVNEKPAVSLIAPRIADYIRESLA